MANTKIKWEEANFKWEKAPGNQDTDGSIVPYTWDDVTLLEDLLSQGASGSEIAYHVELVCKVKGIETYSGQKTIRDNIEVSAEDVELVIKEVLGIDLTVENIHV